MFETNLIHAIDFVSVDQTYKHNKKILISSSSCDHFFESMNETNNMCSDVKRGRHFYRCLGLIVNVSKKAISENHLFLSNSLGSYQSEGETSRPPSGRRLTPIENAPLIPEAVVPSPPSGVVSLYDDMLLKHL